MNKWYRYLEIMNFGDGDKRTSVMSSSHEKTEKELDHIISDYKVILKLTENQYKEIDKLLKYKGEFSYNELRAKVSVLTDKIDNAIEYIKNNAWYMNKDDKEILDRVGIEGLLEILGDKENE